MAASQIEESLQSFFISYASADRIWAEWIGWQLEENGFTAILPESGLRSDMNFAIEIDGIFKKAQRIIVILSPDYLRALYGQLDWAIMLKQEAAREQRLIVPVVVRECRQGLKSLGLASINMPDLVGKHETAAQNILLNDIRLESKQPRVLENLADPLEDQDLRTDLQQQLRLIMQQSQAYDWRNSASGKAELAALPLHRIPYERNRSFTDREDTLDLLARAFFQEGMLVAQPQALVGLGGIGKTQLALEYAYRNKDRYHYIFWIQAHDKNSLITDFHTIATELNLAIPSTQDANVTLMQVKRWLSEHRDWLLIFDGVHEPEMVSEFVPSEPKGHILLTTRSQTVGMAVQSIIVNKWGQEDAACFLLRRVNKLAPSEPLGFAAPPDLHAAEKIAQELDGLPLALDQAGAYIEKTRCSLSDYLTTYAGRGRLLEPTSESARTVSAVWSLSFDKVAEALPAAADLLRLCAFLAPDSIPEAIIMQGAASLGPVLEPVATDPFLLHDAIEELSKFSFLSRDAHRKTLSMHPLVQEVLRERMSPETRRLWAERATRAVNAVFPEVDVAGWRQCNRYFPHASACTSLILNSDYAMHFEEAARLLHQVGAYLVELALYREAEPFYKKAIEMYKELKGPDDAIVATVLNAQAWLYRTLDQYEKAEELFKEALALREKTLGQHHAETVQTLSDLAWLHYNQGRYADSLSLHEHALELRRSIFGSNRPGAAVSLNNVAWLNFMLGNYMKAEEYYQQALAIRERVGLSHPYLADTFANLARLYLEQARYQEAEEYYTRSLDIRTQALHAGHSDIAHSLDGLGQVKYFQGRYAEAENNYVQAWSIREEVFGEDHRSVAQTLTHLGRLRHTLGRYDESEKLYGRALDIRARLLGAKHPDVAQTLTHMGRLYHTLGRYTQAEKLYEQALQIRGQTLNTDHPLVAHILNNQARLYHALGRYNEAESLYQEALAMRVRALGANHPDVAKTLNNMASLACTQGKYAQAKEYAEQARSLWEKNPGPKHLYMAFILNTLGEILVGQDQDEQAEELFREAWSLHLDCLDSDHPSKIPIMANLAALYCKKGQYDEAESLYQHMLTMYEQHAFANAEAIHIIERYADLLRKMNSDSEATKVLKRIQAIRDGDQQTRRGVII